MQSRVLHHAVLTAPLTIPISRVSPCFLRGILHLDGQQRPQSLSCPLLPPPLLSLVLGAPPKPGAEQIH